MADASVYYYGWEGKCFLAVESSYGSASVTGGDYIQPAYIRALSMNLNENVERIYTAGHSYRRAPETEVKGWKQVTAHIEFWMADDFDTTEVEPFLSKFGVDRYNTALSTNTWVIPDTADSIYGSLSLMPFTLEAGWDKTADLRQRIMTGCYVDSETVTFAKGEKILWAWDIVAQNQTTATAFVGTGTKSTNPPLDWSNVELSWKGEDDTLAAMSGCTNLTWTTANTLEPDLSPAVSPSLTRQVTDFIPGSKLITGTMTWYKKTTTGQNWAQIVYSATAGKTTPDKTINLGAIRTKIESTEQTATYYLQYDLYDVVLGELPEDIDFSKVQEITLPYTARYLTATIETLNVGNEPANWDEQE